jgi:iron complex transport system ATP-binding protein
VLLARAICQQPEIIILDEPTSFLDIRHKLQLLSILRTMAKQKGITVIMSLHEIDLAQKISDKILCVQGDHVASFGPPETVFEAGNIRRLYGIEQGSYDPLFGSIELPRPEGEPQALVLSACGTGIPVYRSLQKQGVPFVAGILYSNDIDCRLARVLAAEVIEERPFMPIGDDAFSRALYWIERLPRVINAGVEIGQTNARMAELIERAKDKS